MVDYIAFVEKRIDELTEEIEKTMSQGSWTTDILAALYKIRKFNEELLEKLKYGGK